MSEGERSVLNEKLEQRASRPPLVEALARLSRNKLAMTGVVIIAIMVTVSVVVAPLYLPDPLEMSPQEPLMPPSSRHLFGTDVHGRDMLSRTVHGIWTSIFVATVSVAVAVVLGASLGLSTGYVGGRFDELIMRFLDIVLAFPVMLLALGVVAALGPSTRNLILTMAFIYAVPFARVVRGPVLSIKEREFVLAAKAIGVGNGRIMRNHILPNVVAPMIVQTVLSLSSAMLLEAAMSFLGLGTQPPTPSLGYMINNARIYMGMAPWLSIFPGLFIFIVVMSFNLLGDGLRDAFDPRTWF
jgi:peptide/nickel transport system permease protein